MTNTIRLKRGVGIPSPSSLVTGELAVDTATGEVYTKKDDGSVVLVAGGGGGGGAYLPLAGGTMTGAIVFDGTSGQYIYKGTFDTARGGNNGISLVCSIGYEFNWQAGWLTTTEQGVTTPRPLYLDSLAGTTLRVWDSATSTGTEVTHTGVTFADATSQTTAYADAPSDGKAYSRKDAGWVTDRINAYDNAVTYTLGDQVVFSNAIYEMTTVAGAAGYDPIGHPSYWTGISGPTGAAGTNGTNGINGTMNPLDILTITANSYGAYVSSGSWSVNYTFINSGSMSGSWMSNRYPTVYFNLYVNGVLDSTISGSYSYYYTSGIPTTTTFNTGDHIEVKLSDGSGGEATFNYADFIF